ncbi:MAG: SLBB domain-containing protein [Rhodothermia bacterium]|nr:SLBB domain-containing protein [Rhodothermia bacterium]
MSIWGEVRNPGQYEVPVGTELIQLLSYAGGPLVSADLRRIRIIRREANGKHYESVLTVDVSRLVDSPDRIPTIQPGDVIVVGRRSSVVFAQEIMPVFRDVIFLALYLLISLNTLGVF